MSAAESPREVPPRDEPPQLTTYHVRRALEGDRDSLGWMVSHFTPLLRAQAILRIGPELRGQFPVDDLVAEAWLVLLRRRGELARDESRSTPRVLRFLGTAIVHIANRRIEEFFRRGRRYVEPPKDRDPDGGLNELADTVTGALTKIARDETAAALDAALEKLAPADRDVIVLRLVEGLSNQEAAQELGEAPNTVSQRYRRAIARLREALPADFFADFDPD